MRTAISHSHALCVGPRPSSDMDIAPRDVSLALPRLPVQELIPFLQPDPEVDDTTRVRSFVSQISPRFQ